MTRYVTRDGGLLILDGKFVFSDNPAACICCDDVSSSSSESSSSSSSSESSSSSSSLSESESLSESISLSESESLSESLSSSESETSSNSESESRSSASSESTSSSESSSSGSESEECPPGGYRLVIDWSFDTAVAGAVATERNVTTGTGTSATGIIWDYNRSGPGNNLDGTMSFELLGLPKFLTEEDTFDHDLEVTLNAVWIGALNSIGTFSEIESGQASESLIFGNSPSLTLTFPEIPDFLSGGTATTRLDIAPTGNPPFPPELTVMWSYEPCDDSSSLSSESSSSSSSNSDSSSSSLSSSSSDPSSSEDCLDYRLIITATGRAANETEDIFTFDGTTLLLPWDHSSLTPNGGTGLLIATITDLPPATITQDQFDNLSPITIGFTWDVGNISGNPIEQGFGSIFGGTSFSSQNGISGSLSLTGDFLREGGGFSYLSDSPFNDAPRFGITFEYVPCSEP